jgi:hypothetical protein
MALMDSGRWSMTEWVPMRAMISMGLRFFLNNFLEGQVEWKYLALT